jgi:hypothetical protein
LKFLGSIGNILSPNTGDKAVLRGQEQQIRINPLTPKIMGLDPAFGSSAFGIVIVQMESIVPNTRTSNQTDFRSDSIRYIVRILSSLILMHACGNP